MTPQGIQLRAAGPDDFFFVVVMARHACVIEDRPLPDPHDADVLEMLPPEGVVPIIAEDRSGAPVGAAWTYRRSPPLRCDAAGVPLPELCIAVAPGRRGAGIGGTLLDALFADLAVGHDAMVRQRSRPQSRQAALRAHGFSARQARTRAAGPRVDQRPSISPRTWARRLPAPVVRSPSPG